MFWKLTLLLMGWLALPALSAVRSGKATAEWISAATTCEPGTPVRTAIRLVLDEGWHTYWRNPGDSGMKPGIEWQLPPGWAASELAFPVPHRFQTGDLPNFGYTGTVVFPVTLTPPADFAGTVKLGARISWLTCDETLCVPGDAALSLTLESGPLAATAQAEVIRNALKKIPRPGEDQAVLSVTENPASLVLKLDVREGGRLDPLRCDIVPATPEVIDSAAVIRFTRDGQQWTAEVPKSEYATSLVKELTLVFTGPGTVEPIELSWHAR